MGHPDRLAATEAMEARALEICRGIQRKCQLAMRELEEVTDITTPPAPPTARDEASEDSIVKVVEPARGRVKTLENMAEQAAKAAC